VTVPEARHDEVMTKLKALVAARAQQREARPGP